MYDFVFFLTLYVTADNAFVQSLNNVFGITCADGALEKIELFIVRKLEQWGCDGLDAADNSFHQTSLYSLMGLIKRKVTLQPGNGCFEA